MWKHNMLVYELIFRRATSLNLGIQNVNISTRFFPDVKSEIWCYSYIWNVLNESYDTKLKL